MLKRFIYIFVILFTIMSIGRVTVFAQMTSADTAVSVSEDGKVEDSADSADGADSTSSETQPRTDKENSDFGESAVDKKTEEQIDQPVDDGKKSLTYLDAEAGKEETLRIEEGEKVNILPSVGKYNGVAGNIVIFLKEDKKISDAAAPEGKTFIGWKAEKTQGEYAYTLTAQYKDTSGARKKKAESKASDEYNNEQDERIQNTSEDTFFDKYPAFAGSETIGDITVMVTAENGVFPEGSSLSVTQVSKEDREKTLKAVDDIRKDDAVKIANRTFDIKVLDAGGNEMQPIPGKKVNVTFDTKGVADKNHDTRIYHTEGDSFETRELDVKTKGTAATAETTGFSYYTVEFTYDEKQYVLEGDSVVKLSDILTYVGLTGEVSSYEVSNHELFNIFMGDEDGIDYIYEDDTEIPSSKDGGTIHYMAALKPFKTDEWLKVTIDGVEYIVAVTDDYIDSGGATVTNARVTQGGNEENFSNSMPLASIWVDESVFNTTTWNNGSADGLTVIATPKFTGTDSAFAGLNVNTTIGGNTTGLGADGKLNESGDYFVDGSFSRGATSCKGFLHRSYGALYFDFTKGDLASYSSTVSNAKPDADSYSKFFPGDIVEYRIKDAAQYFNVETQKYEKADVVITYSDLFITLQDNIIQSDYNKLKNTVKYLNILDTNMVFPQFGIGAEASGTTKNHRAGVTVKSNIRVVHTDENGQDVLVDGSYYFPMLDIDINRYDDGQGFTHFASHPDDVSGNVRYSEQVALLENYGQPTSGSEWEQKAWIPGGDFDSTKARDANTNMPYLTGIKDANVYGDSDKELVFYANKRYTFINNPPTRDVDFYTGFLTLANNTAGGVKTMSWSTAAGTSGVESYLMAGTRPVNHKVASSSDQGGTIYTTTTGNPEGDLSGGQRLGYDRVNNPYELSAATGQNVTYTMTPKVGYTLKTVYVKDNNVDVMADKDNAVEVYRKDDANPSSPFRYEGNGIYTYTFSAVDSDKSIHVEWEPTKIKVTKNVVQNGWNEPDTFKFRISVEDPNPKTDTYRVRVYKGGTTESTYVFDNSIANRVIHQNGSIIDAGQNRLLIVTDSNNRNKKYILGWDNAEDRWLYQEVSVNSPITSFDDSNKYMWKTVVVKEKDSEGNDFENYYLYNVGADAYVTKKSTTPSFGNNVDYEVGGSGDKVSYIEDQIGLNINENTGVYSVGDRTEWDPQIQSDIFSWELGEDVFGAENYNLINNNAGYNIDSGYTAVTGEAGLYVITLPQGQTPALQDPNLIADGWQVSTVLVPAAVFDVKTPMEDRGATLVDGTENTYEFTLAGGASANFEACIPAGWKYTITEVGEDDTDLTNDIPGTKPGWQFVSKTANAVVGNFDGDEDVTFTNERRPKEIKVTKIWNDDNDSYGIRPSDYINTLNFDVKVQDSESNAEVIYNSINDAVSKREITPGQAEYVFHAKWTEKITDVTETVPTGYEVEYAVAPDGKSATITNTPNVYDLTVVKTVTSTKGLDVDKTFGFTLSIPQLANKSIVDSDGNTYAFDANGNTTFTLKHGQSVIFKNLVHSTKYTITEDDYIGDSYTTQVKPDGSAAYSDGRSVATGSSGITKDMTENFKNNYETMDMEVYKQWHDNDTQRDAHTSEELIKALRIYQNGTDVTSTYADTTNGVSKNYTDSSGVSRKYLTVTPDATNSKWTYALTGLPRYYYDSGEQKEYVYKVGEPEAFDGYADPEYVDLDGTITYNPTDSGGTQIQATTDPTPGIQFLGYEVDPSNPPSDKDYYQYTITYEDNNGNVLATPVTDSDGKYATGDMKITPPMYFEYGGQIYQMSGHIYSYAGGSWGTNYDSQYGDFSIDPETGTVYVGAYTLWGGEMGNHDGGTGEFYVEYEVLYGAQPSSQAVGVQNKGTINNRALYDLTVSKTTTGDMEDKNKEFTFTVTCTELAGKTLKDGSDADVVFDSNGVHTFTLKDGQNKVIKGITYGFDVDVSEADYSSEGYKTTYVRDGGDSVSGRTAVINDISDNVSLAYTNEMTYFDITINKTAVDSSETEARDAVFTYKIKVYKDPAGAGQERKYLDLSEEPNYLTSLGDNSYELTISTEGGNGTGEVLRIPYGFKYEITENDRFGWRLLNVDGDSDKTSATGQAFTDATHTFTNKKLKFCLIKEWDDYSNSYDTRPDDLDVNVNLIGDNTDFDIDTIPWDKDTYEQENLWVKEFELPDVTESNIRPSMSIWQISTSENYEAYAECSGDIFGTGNRIKVTFGSNSDFEFPSWGASVRLSGFDNYNGEYLYYLEPEPNGDGTYSFYVEKSWMSHPEEGFTFTWSIDPTDNSSYDTENYTGLIKLEAEGAATSYSYNTFMGASAYEEEVPYGYTDTIREDDFEYNPDTDTYEAKLKNTVNDRIKLKKSWVDRSDMFNIRPADLSTTITNVEEQLIYNRDWIRDGDSWTKTIVTNNPKGTYTSYTASETAPVFYGRTDTGGGVMTFNADTGCYEYTFENTLKTKDLTITKNTENNAAGTFKIKLKVIMPETRTRTIHYLDDYGNKLSPDTVQVVTFLPTDASAYTVSGSWSEVVAPSEIDGRYTYDTTRFPAKDMTGSTPTSVTNEERYVYYTYTPSTSINVGLAYRVYSGGTWGGVVAKPQTITVSGGSLTESKTLTFTPGVAAQEVELPGAGTYTISMADITKEDLKPEADLLALQDSPMPLIIDTVSTTVTVDESGNCTVGRTICTSFAFGADQDNNFIYNDIEELKNAYGGTGADTKLNVLNPHSSNAGASASGKTVTLTTVISQGWDDSTDIAVK